MKLDQAKPALHASRTTVTKQSAEKESKIEPRKAKDPRERAKLLWQWAFEEIKKGKFQNAALHNISMHIGKTELIDVHHTDSDESDEDVRIEMQTKNIERTMTLNSFKSSECTPKSKGGKKKDKDLEMSLISIAQN